VTVTPPMELPKVEEISTLGKVAW